MRIYGVTSTVDTPCFRYCLYCVFARIDSDVLGTSKSKCSAFIGRGVACEEVSASVSEWLQPWELSPHGDPGRVWGLLELSSPHGHMRGYSTYVTYDKIHYRLIDLQ